MLITCVTFNSKEVFRFQENLRNFGSLFLGFADFWVPKLSLKSRVPFKINPDISLIVSFKSRIPACHQMSQIQNLA